jgi:hypothetical protein
MANMLIAETPMNQAAADVPERLARAMYEDAYKRQSERPYEKWELASSYARDEWIAVAKSAITYLHKSECNSSEVRLLNQVLDATSKHDIADNITIEGRSKTDVVQDVWDELVRRGLISGTKGESTNELVSVISPQYLLQKLEGCIARPAVTDPERNMNHFICEAMDFIKHHIDVEVFPEASEREIDKAINAAHRMHNLPLNIRSQFRVAGLRVIKTNSIETQNARDA